MASDLTVLAFDTSAAHCAAALFSGDRIVARSEAMGKGQAERLFPLLEELLSEAGLGWSDLDRIGVGIGPGNFTGIRISVSAARGLALSLGIPAVGVSGLEALGADSASSIAAIPAPRGMAYLQQAKAAPKIVAQAEVPPNATWLDCPKALTASIARMARNALPDRHPATPLYLRPADAAPSRDAAPRILDDV